MAEYTGLQSVLNATLGEYRAKGFRLVEPDDHTLVLYFRDERVCVVSAQTALIQAIREVCRNHLERLTVD